MQFTAIDLMAAIYERRAIRAFTSEAVPPADIDRLIEAAIQAPSSMGLEPWAFVVIEGATKLKQYSDRAKTHFAPKGLSEAGALRIRGMLSDPNFNIFHDAS
jgi:nitroreductase